MQISENVCFRTVHDEVEGYICVEVRVWIRVNVKMKVRSVVLTFPFSQGISVLIVGHNVFIFLSSTHTPELRQYC